MAGTLVTLLIFIKLYYETGLGSALVGGVFHSFLYIQILYSQSARPEVFTSLIGFLAFSFWLKLINKGDLSSYIIYSVFSLIGLYSYFFYHWIFITQIVILFVMKTIKRESLLRPTTMMTTCATLYMLWFIPNVLHGPIPSPFYWYSSPGIKNLLDIFWQYFSSLPLALFFGILFIKDAFYGLIKRNSTSFTPNDFMTSYFIAGLILFVFLKSLISFSSFTLAHFSIIHPVFSYLLARRLQRPFTFPYLGIVFYLIIGYNVFFIQENFYDNESWFDINAIHDDRVLSCPETKDWGRL